LFDDRIFTVAQNGLRKGKCTETTIQSLIEIIQEALDKGLHTNGIFFYLTKAYYVSNHNILLKKLHSYGIMGRINPWFPSQWASQKHFIKINHSDARNNKQV
jgi:hypothetical protein